MTTPLPRDWQTDEILDGLELVDKAELLGNPFRITGCRFELNANNVSLCYIDAQRIDGTGFTFQDSSTGVRAQLVKYLNDKGLDAGIETGEYIEFVLVAPNGLRKSDYETPARTPSGAVIPGKVRQGTTYYLTTSGKRSTGPVKSTPKAAASRAK